MEWAEQDTTDTEKNIKLDLARDYELSGHAARVKFGGKLSRRDKDNDTNVWTYEDFDDAGIADDDLLLGHFTKGRVDYGLGRFGPGIGGTGMALLTCTLALGCGAGGSGGSGKDKQPTSAAPSSGSTGGSRTSTSGSPSSSGSAATATACWIRRAFRPGTPPKPSSSGRSTRSWQRRTTTSGTWATNGR